MRRSWVVAVLAAGLLPAGGSVAHAQLRVGPEVDLSDPGPGPGTAPVLSYDTTRGGWLAFWFHWDDLSEEQETPRLISRYVSPDLRPKHDSNTEFDGGIPVTAAYDPVTDEHILTSGGTSYQSTGFVRRYSPTGAVDAGPWRLADGAMLPSVAVDTSSGTGIVVYITEPAFDDRTTVWAQRLAPGGGLQGAPIQLSQEGTKVDLHRAAVVFNPVRGEFAVAWRERRSGIGAFVGDIIMTRLPAVAGGPIGVPAAISDSRSAIVAQAPGEIPDGAGAPGLAYDPATGGYLVTWLSARGDVLESPTQVYGQRLDGDLREVGPDDFRISSGPGLVKDWFPIVVANDGMVVVWGRQLGDVPQVVGRRVTDGALIEPALLWTAGAYGIEGTPDLAGPASGPLLLGMAADFTSSRLDHAQVRAVGDGADPGSARIVSAPPGTSPSRTASFGLERGGPDGSLQCRLDEDAWRACTTPHVVSDLPDEPHRLQVRALGPDRWVQPDPVAVEWRVEAAPPDTRITDVPEANERYGLFEFVADEPADFECRIDDGAWSRCGDGRRSGWDSFNNLADGVHRFEVRAIDDAGHLDPSPAVWIWTVDTKAPETYADDGPTGVTPPPGTFTFHSDDPGARFECIDVDEGSSGTWRACESGVPFTTRRGVFRVRAIDAAGNTDPSPARWQWSPETDAPQMSFVGSNLPAGNVFTSRDVTISYLPTATTVDECRLDGGAWQRCASPARYEGLADGAHVFAVRATSRAGVTGPPAELQFSVDTRRPTVFVTEKPRWRTLVRSARIAFGATRAATFTCAVDGAPAQSCTSPIVLDNVTVGFHTVEIRATGAGGWTAPSRYVSWQVVTDPNAPAPMAARTRAQARAAAAAAPPTPWFDLTPAAYMRTNSASFEWDWSETGEVSGSECRLDSSDWALCSSPLTLRDLADGDHHFEVRNFNSAGERSAGVAKHDWTVDTITAHVIFDRTPRGRTNEEPVTVVFHPDRAGATLQCRSADTAFVACTSPYTAAGQPEGAYRLIVRAVNQGRIGPQRTVNWVVDRTPPDTELRAERVSPGMTTNRRDLAFEVRVLGYGYEDIAGEVEPEFYTVKCRLDGGAWNYCANVEPLQGLADGPHVLEAVADDYAGNVDPTPARLAWTVDTGAADTFVDAGPAATEPARSATFALRAQPAGDSFECRLDGGAWRACPATHTLTGVADGSHTLEARATGGGSPDPTPARWLWTVDAEPTPVVVSGPPPVTTDGTARFELASDDPAARIECRLDGGAWQTCGTGPVFAVADGAHALAVRAVDGGGKSGELADEWRWSVDTRAPDTVLVSAPEPLRRWRDAELAFRSDDGGVRFQCRLDGGAWATCKSPHWVGGLSDATHMVEARAVDAAGNVEATPVSATWRVDSVAPNPQLTSSPAIGQWTRRTAVTFTVSAGEPITVAECRLDEGDWTPCRDGAAFAGLTDGPHAVEARVVDEAGNAKYTVKQWTTLSRPVDTEIVGRPPASWTGSFNRFEFMGDSFDIYPFFYVCSLDGGAWQSCSTPQTYSSLPVGRHVFEVAVIDGDGQPDATPARWEWEIRASGAAGSASSTREPAAAPAPDVARGAAEAISAALAGPRWRRVLTGRRRVAVTGAPRELVVRVRSRGRVVAGRKVRIRATGTRRLALRPRTRLRPGARASVSVTWRPASGARQTARLTRRLGR